MQPFIETDECRKQMVSFLGQNIPKPVETSCSTDVAFLALSNTTWLSYVH